MKAINTTYLKSHKCYVGQNKPKYIVVHETDNWDFGAGAIRHGKAHYNGNLSAASVHYYVDDQNIVQTLNHEDGPWAVGDNDGYSDITNYDSVNLEICVNPDSSYDLAWYNAVDLVRYLMQLLNIPASNVKTHHDASGKWCPRKMLDNNWWPNFMDYINNPSKSTPTNPQYNLPSDFDPITYILNTGNQDVLTCILNGGFNSYCNIDNIKAAAIKHYNEFGKNENRLYK